MTQTPNHSVEPTASGLRPPAAAHLKRWADQNVGQAHGIKAAERPHALALTVGELRRALADCPDEAAVGVRVPPGTLSDPLIAESPDTGGCAAPSDFRILRSREQPAAARSERNSAPCSHCSRSLCSRPRRHRLIRPCRVPSRLGSGGPICTVTSECADLRVAARRHGVKHEHGEHEPPPQPPSVQRYSRISPATLN